VSVPSYGAGPALALVLLVTSLILRRRGYNVRRPLAAALSAVACEELFLRTAEVTGADERRQDRVEDAFDRAFEEKAAPPPPRRGRDRSDAGAGTLDGGAVFGDDAGIAGGG
jgi:uncharacterized protein (TIGR03382 family)